MTKYGTGLILHSQGKINQHATNRDKVRIIIMGGKVSKNIDSLEPLSPLPTPEELAKDGGKYFVRPSDGRNLEYYVLESATTAADADTAIVNLITTASTGLLYHKLYQNEVTKILEQNPSVKIVNISTAGVGPSEPYGTRLGDPSITSDKYKENTSKDVIALLKSIGIRNVYTMGVSGGWETSAHLAATILREEEEEPQTEALRLKGVCNARGIPWITKDARTNEFWSLSLGKGFAFSVSMFFMHFVPFLPHLVDSMMYPMDVEKMKKNPQAVEMMEEMGGDEKERMFELVAENVNRADEYYHFVSCYLGRLTCPYNEEDKPDATRLLDDLKKFTEAKNIPVNLHYGKKDNSVPTDIVLPYMIERLPNANNLLDDGGHFPRYVAMIEKLLEQQPTQSK